MGFKSKKKARMESLKENYPRFKKHNRQKKNRHPKMAAPSVATNSHLAWWDRSLPRPVGETGRRSVGNRKEPTSDYASSPGDCYAL